MNRICLLIASLLTTSTALAQGIPATFDVAEDSLVERIEFPEVRGDIDGRIGCAAIVTRNGKVDDIGCYAQTPGDEIFIRAIVLAARKARLTPAIVDGEPARVYVQFQVRFTKQGDEQSISILNNPGLTENIEAYGEDHVAAQRALTDEEWSKVCPRRTRFMVWAKAHVADDGAASHFSLVPGDGPAVTAKCQEAILATLAESRYTAARADGEPVPSSFIEPFGN